MNLKVKIYQAMPSFVKVAMTKAYIQLRKMREAREARRVDGNVDQSRIQLALISGFPRSGTTVLKYYFASHEGLQQTAFDPAGFYVAWRKAQESDTLLVDKSNHYIYAFENLFASYGRAVRLCVIVRDPRDCIVSFTKYLENREVPRSKAFWPYWSRQHSQLLRFARTSKFADCILFIRYEDFVLYPEQAKACFLNWLGFDVSPSDLDRRYSNQNPGEGWKDSVHEYREVGDHPLQKWKQPEELPTWAASILQGWVGDGEVKSLMQAFGYTEDGLSSPSISTKDINLFTPSRD